MNQAQEIVQAANVQISQKSKLSSHGFGQWNEKQIYKYFLFVYHNRQKFHSKSMRKSVKIFKLMAKFIKTRNSCQCRTHHQNVLKKSRNLDQALKKFITSHQCFSRKYELIKNSLKIIDDMEFCQDTSTVVRQSKLEHNSETENSNLKTQKIPEVFMMSAITSIPEFSSNYMPMIDLRMQKILECQYFFTQWIKRMNQLGQYQVI